MVGKYQLQFGAAQFVQGMATSDYAPDGGIGASSFGLNPFINRGLIYSSAPLTNKSTNLVGQLIASCDYGATATTQGRMLVDNAANFYTATNAGTLTKQVTGTQTTHYVLGKTDMVPFSNKIYVSEDNDVCQWDGSTSIDEDWGTNIAGFSFSSAAYPHPMLVYQSHLWIADGNNMNSFDGGSAYATTALLNFNEVISAIGIDPFTGLMLIAFHTAFLGNYNDTQATKNYVGLWDGISPLLLRKIPVDETIYAFYNVGGTVYVGAGEIIGQWNGNGVTFLRKLANATFAAANLPYKQHFSNYNNNLLVIDGTNVLCYGEVIAGRKAWFPIIYNSVNTSNIDTVSPLGSGVFAISMATATPTYQFYTCDLTSNAAGGINTLYLPWTFFPRPIFVHSMRVFTTGASYSGATDLAIVINGERGSTLPISTGNRLVSVPSGETIYVFDFYFGGAKCQGLQPLVNVGGGNNTYGLISVIIYYDVAE